MNLKTEVTRIQSPPNFPKNERFLTPDTHTYVCVSGGKKRSFFGKFGVLSILVTSVLRFAVLLYYRGIEIMLHMDGGCPALVQKFRERCSDNGRLEFHRTLHKKYGIHQYYIEAAMKNEPLKIYSQ